MVSFMLLHLARNCGRIVRLGGGPPNCPVARCSSVLGIVRPTGYYVPTVRPFEGGMLMRCFALSPGLDTSSS